MYLQYVTSVFGEPKGHIRGHLRYVPGQTGELLVLQPHAQQGQQVQQQTEPGGK